MKFHLVSVLAATTPLLFSQPVLKLSTSRLQPETNYELVFDQAVVTKNELNKPLENSQLKISPKLDGTLMWTARNVAHFHPKAAPKLGTTYTFTTTKGTLYQDGSAVPKTVLATLSTPNFCNNYHRRYSLGNNRMPLSYLRYNDDISAKKVGRKFYYINKDNDTISANVRQATWADLESTYYIKPSWETRFQNTLKKRQGIELPKETQWAKNSPISNGLIVTPSSALNVGDDWTLIEKKGISNASATAKSKGQDSHYIWNIDPFVLDKIIPVIYADSPRSIYVEFKGHLPAKMDAAWLNEHISVSPRPANLRFERRYNDTLQIKGDFTTQDTWKVSISKEFQANNELMLGKNASAEVTFKHVESGVSLASFDTAQLAKGERTFEIGTVNMRELHVQVKSLSREQVIRATQGYRHYSGNGHNYEEFPDKAPLPFELISGTTLFDKKIALDNAIDTSKKVTLLWDDILPNKEPNATLFVSVTGLPKSKIGKKQALKRRAQSIIQLTDIGLAWKISNDQTWVYAYSLESGKPLSDVSIATFGEDAKKLHSTTTDANGLALIQNSDNDRHLIASLGSDQYTVTFDNSLSTVSMWRFPVSFDWSEQVDWERKLMLFSDRNLYRPAETVRIKGILRNSLDNDLRSSKDSTVKVSLRDPRNKEISTAQVSLTSNGTFDHSFTLPEDSVGRFSVRCTVAKNGDQSESRFTHSFSVQEFRRNAFEIKTALEQPKITDTQTTLDLSASYYQGTPVAEGTVRWYSSASQIGFYPEKFRDYLFGDHRDQDDYYWNHYFGYGSANRHRDTQHSNGTVTLNTKGATTITAPIPTREFPAPQSLRIEAEVTDSRDQTLTSSSSTTYFPASLYYGIARTDELVRVGDTKKINLVAVDLKGNYSAIENSATLEIQREYHESVKVLASDGTTRTHNEKRSEVVGSYPIKLAAGKPTAYPFSPTQSGRHIFTIKGADKDGNKTATASSIYVYGSDQYPWATEDGIRIKLVSEQKSYTPGDTARLLVMTPIEGTALVTVERKGVIKSYRRELKANNPVIEFPVEKEFAPNAFVSVLVMRGSQDSPRKHKQPALKLGYCELTVNDESKRLAIEFDTPPSSVLPGEETTLHGTVTDHKGNPVKAAEVLLFAEDEGTLAVMGYKNPDPFKFFNSPLSLTLRTGVSLSYFLDENPDHRYMGNKGFTIGGGGVYADEASESIKSRTNFDPCAAWLPTLTTHEDGRFSATFKTPDTLTRYRVIALAVHGADYFGSAESELIVKKDIMLEPKPPRFANEGDSLKTKVLIENSSKFSGVWAVKLATDSMCSIPRSTDRTLTKTVTLGAGESATLSFPTKCINTGETSWTWSATPQSVEGFKLDKTLKKQLSDSIVNTFNVTYPRPLLHQGKFVKVQPNSGAVELVNGMKPIIMSGRGHMDLEFSNSLLLEAGGASEYLLRYPYGCVEQTTSSMMPWFAVRDLKGIVPGFEDTTEDKVKTALQKGADRLLSMQTSDGGLAYWPGGPSSETWASSYGGMGLLLAKQHGASVPDHATKKLTQFLRNFVKKDSSKDSWRRDTRARALYVLALAKSADVATQNKLYEERDTMTASARAFLALAIHHSSGNREMCINLLQHKSPSINKKHWMRYRSDIPVTLLAWSTIAPQNAQADLTMEKLLKNRNQQGHWRTTWVNGWAMHAMASYARYVEAGRKDVAITLKTSEGTRSINLSKSQPSVALRLPLEEAQSLVVSSNARAYTRILASAKPEVAPSGPISNNGITISRRYERVNERGETSPLDTPNVGDLIKVTLDVGLTANLSYIVIDDPLPSIFESINEDFASQASAQSVKLKKNYRISRSEFRSERTLFFLNRSWGSDKQSISYLARVTAAGTVHAPPAKVEAMYDPSDYALSEAHTLTTVNLEVTAGQ